MIKFVCKECANEWYIEDHKKALIQACPFCLFPVPAEEEIIVDSFEKAILKTIKDLGVDCLKERSRFIGYLLDTSPGYKKEVKILSNACDSGVLHTFYGTKDQDRGTAVKVFTQVQLHMIEEEGIAEQWAKVICDSLLNAIHPQEKPLVTRRTPVTAIQNSAITVVNTQPTLVAKGELFEEKLMAFLEDSDQNRPIAAKATVTPAVNPSTTKTPTHFSANFYVGFEGSFAKVPKVTIPEPPKSQASPAPKTQHPEFVMKGTTLVKYTGTAQDVVIPEGVTAIAFRAFYMNTRIRKVTMPSTLASIEMEAFSYCNQLSTIVFNDKLWQIGIKAFSDCSDIKKLHLGNSILVLGVESFANCVNLEEVRLPQSLTFLHEKVFVGCDKIKAVTVPRGTISIADNAFPPTVRITNE